MTDSQPGHLDLYLINNVEDNVVFLTKKCLFLMISSWAYCSRNAQVTYVKKPQSKIIIFQKINIDF